MIKTEYVHKPAKKWHRNVAAGLGSKDLSNSGRLSRPKPATLAIRTFQRRSGKLYIVVMR